MASLQARHAGACARGTAWSTFATAPDGCSCPGGPTYYVVVRQGRRVHRERVGKNRKAAERALRKIAGQVDDGAYQAQRAIRFTEWAESWIGSLERKPTTVGNYRSTIAYATEAFGTVQVRRLGVEHVVDLGRLLAARELAPSTRAKHLRVLGACLNSAIAHGYAVKNPVKMLPKSEKPRPEKREAAYFEKSEIAPLVDAYPQGVYRVLTQIALRTGMRQGELLALTWGAVDLTEAVARVRLTRTGGHTHSPKNHEKRDVDLTADAMGLLTDWRAELGDPVGDVLVFPGAGADGYLDPTTVTSRELYGAMERGGIDRKGPTGELRTFHSLRHTFAKRALERGAQIAWLSRHLGHSSIVVTIGVYGHWERAERRRQVELLAGAFS